MKRKYNDPPVVYGGNAACVHEWATEQYVHNTDKTAGEKQRTSVGSVGRDEPIKRDTCTLCGAWRGELGWEPTPQLFVAHLVEVFAEAWRVLRDDGLLFVNLMDTRVGGKGASGQGTEAYQAKRVARGESITKAQSNLGIPKGTKPSDDMRVMRSVGLKPKDMALVPQRFVIAMQEYGWYVRSTIIWAKGESYNPYRAGSAMPECLDPDTQVFIEREGWVSRSTLRYIATMQDNGEPLPKILGPKGFIEIRNVWRTMKPAVSLYASKVEYVVCSPDHRFPVSSDRRREKVRYETAENIRHEGYADYLLYAPIGRLLPEAKIKTLHGIDLDYALGFLLGAYTAEGGREEGYGIKLTFNKNELSFINKIASILHRYGVAARITDGQSNDTSIEWNDERTARLVDMFVHGKVKTKSLNIEMLLNCPEAFRLGFLEGYVEGDGHERKGKPGWVAASASKRLRDDLSTLASSVGIITSKGAREAKDKRTGNTYRAWTLWTPYITKRKTKSGTEGVFQVPPRTRRNLGEEREMIDIEVDGHEFLIGDGLITHNSAKDRPTDTFEYIFMFSKEPRYYSDMAAVAEAAGYPQDKRRPVGSNGAWEIDGRARRSNGGGKAYEHDTATRNLRSVWTLPPAKLDGDVFRINTRGTSIKHYATWSQELAETMIKMSTPEHGACSVCGAPWERITERTGEITSGGNGSRTAEHNGLSPSSGIRSKTWAQNSTVGWRPTCDHADAERVPSVVLDPFGGSGTTGRAAYALGRNSICIELKPEYHEIAEEHNPAAEKPTAPLANEQRAENGQMVLF